MRKTHLIVSIIITHIFSCKEKIYERPINVIEHWKNRSLL